MRYDGAVHLRPINGLGGLKQATDVSSVARGEHVGQPKSSTDQDLSGKTPRRSRRTCARGFRRTIPSTDFNSFFQRTAVHIKRQNLVLAPLNIVFLRRRA